MFLTRKQPHNCYLVRRDMARFVAIQSRGPKARMRYDRTLGNARQERFLRVDREVQRSLYC